MVENRQLYREKFEVVCEILDGVLDFQKPEAGFYLWPQTPTDDTAFARDLYQRYNLTVLPGRYLSRDANGDNPGAGRVRMALVASLDDCRRAAEHIRDYCRESGA